MISKRIYYPTALKPVRWVGNSRTAVRAFPSQARRDVGYQLYRVLYLATRPRAIYVLHAFAKKRRATPKLDIDLARVRLKELRRNPTRD